MDGIVETVENIGLAQEIQNGLAKNEQREPAWPPQDAIAAKEAALKQLGREGCAKMDLGKWLMDEWSRSAGRSFDDAGAWDAFTASSAFPLFAKYAALSDSLATVTPAAKQFLEMRPLGRGAFGVVFLVFKKDSGYGLATKKIVKGLAKQNRMVDSVVIEQKVLATVKSRFCVALHYSFQDDVCVYLVLSLAPGGDLWFLLQQRTVDPSTGKPCDFRKLPDGAVRFYTASMACGLQAIHEAGFVYRDLKPHNVLLDADGQLQISDMGLCVDISKGPVTPENDPLGPSIRHGTCGYWPPEVIREEPYTTGPDWWALGITAFQIFCDRLPFFGDNDEMKNENILKAAEILPTRYYHGEPPELQSLVSALCNVDTVARLGAVKGEWTGRPGPGEGLAEVRQHEFFHGFDWGALEAGRMPAPIQPNVNDINAPSKNEIEPFVKPKGIEWTAEDEAKFHPPACTWDYMNPAMHGVEAICRIRKRNELKAALEADGLKYVPLKPVASGGCCAIL